MTLKIRGKLISPGKIVFLVSLMDNRIKAEDIKIGDIVSFVEHVGPWEIIDIIKQGWQDLIGICVKQAENTNSLIYYL